MHHALCLEEILFNIFGYCSPPNSIHFLVERRRYTADLAALARTCQTFKEPALDVLWSQLDDLSPLARCLPEACHSKFGKVYSFSRPLSEAEWTTLRGFARRVRSILDFPTNFSLLDDASMMTILNPPFVDPLFPKLRSLCWQSRRKFPVLYHAIPFLTSLDLDLQHWLWNTSTIAFLNSAVDLFPNIQRLRICMSNPHLNGIISGVLCRWTSLQVVDCPDVILNTGAISQLSSVVTLGWLSFTLSSKSADKIRGFGSVMAFSSLVHLEITSDTLTSVMWLLSSTRLPSIKTFVVKFLTYASKQIIQAYMTTVRDVFPPDTLAHLKLLNVPARFNQCGHPCRQLCLEDIFPCASFVNLCTIHVNLNWSVRLKDADLFDLVSASPCLEHLIINDIWGWRTVGGITFLGLLKLLRACPSLFDFCLAIDMLSYTEILRGLRVEFPARRRLWMNVADSAIEQTYVPALVLVFRELRLEPAVFVAWDGAQMADLAGAGNARRLWAYVYDQVTNAI